MRVLLTADAESDVLARLDLPRVDVLKVSHHGSADEGLPALLERLRPRVAVIEVGAGNTYGHPVPGHASRRCGRRAPRVLRTDRTATCASCSRRAGADVTLRRWTADRAAATSRLGRVPAFKPAYLIHGDDHGRVGERRARLRALAESESGVGGVEQLEGDAGRRRRSRCARRADLRARPALRDRRRRRALEGRRRRGELAPLLADPPPDTTIAFFAREDARQQAPKALHAAIKAAGGDVAAERLLKAARAAALGDRRGRAARREARRRGGAGAGRRASATGSSGCCASSRSSRSSTARARRSASRRSRRPRPSAERQAWSLADAIVAGDRDAALARLPRAARAGRGSGAPRPARGAAASATCSAIAERLEAGESPAEVKSSLRMSPYAADRRIKEARATDVGALHARARGDGRARAGARAAAASSTADTEALRSQ